MFKTIWDFYHQRCGLNIGWGETCGKELVRSFYDASNNQKVLDMLDGTSHNEVRRFLAGVSIIEVNEGFCEILEMVKDPQNCPWTIVRGTITNTRQVNFSSAV